MEYIEIQQVQVPVIGEFRAPAFLVTVAVEQLAKRLKKPTDPFEAVLPSLFQFQNVPWFFETKAGTIELLNPATFDLPSGRWRPEQCVVGILFRQKDLRNPDLELLLRFAADELEVARLHLRPAVSSSRAGKKVPKRQPWHPAVDRVDSDPLLRRLISRFLPGHHRGSAESLSASALRALGIPVGERIIQVYRERKAPANAGSVVPAAMPGKPGAPNRTTTLPPPGASAGGKAMAEGGTYAEEDAALRGAEVASAGQSAGTKRAPLDRRAGEGDPSHVGQKEAAAGAAANEGGFGQGKRTEAPSAGDHHLAATSPAPGAEEAATEPPPRDFEDAPAGLAGREEPPPFEPQPWHIAEEVPWPTAGLLQEGEVGPPTMEDGGWEDRRGTAADSSGPCEGITTSSPLFGYSHPDEGENLPAEPPQETSTVHTSHPRGAVDRAPAETTTSVSAAEPRMEVGQAAQPEQMTDEKSQRFAQGASGGGAPTVCAGGEGAIPPEMYDLAHAQWEDIRRRRAPDLPELAELLTILQDRYPEEPERREKTLKVLAGSKGDEKNAVARARALLRGKHQEGG